MSKTQAGLGLWWPLSVEYNWNNEGQMTLMRYPQTYAPNGGGGYDPAPRRELGYVRNAMGEVERATHGSA